MNLLTKRMALLSAAVVGTGAIATITTGASFALFTASASPQHNTFAAGTVSLGTPTNIPIDLTNLAPGDTAQSEYTVGYTGSLPAFLLVKISHAGTGLGLALGVGSGANGACIIGADQDGTTSGGNWCTTTTDAATLDGTYLIPVDYWSWYYGAGSDAVYLVPGESSLGDNVLCTTQSSGGPPGAVYCGPSGPPAGALATGRTVAGNGDSADIWLYTQLDQNAGNAFQGKSVTVTVQVEAIQAENNSIACPGPTSVIPPQGLGGDLCPVTLP